MIDIEGYQFKTKTVACYEDTEDGWCIGNNYVSDFITETDTLTMALNDYKEHLRKCGIELEDGITPGERCDGEHYLISYGKIVGFRFRASMDAEVYDKRGNAELKKKRLTVKVWVYKIGTPDLRTEY